MTGLATPTTAAPARRRLAGALAYGLLFLVALPLGLAAWMWALDAVVALPDPGAPGVGFAVLACGVALMAGATGSLWVRGGGLPMSPYPPARLVSGGLYRLVAHPIYIGAVLACAGASLAWRSAAGLWIVTPVLALAAAAFVLGYERDATRARFGDLPRPLLSLPVYALLAQFGALWAVACRLSERVANSWQEWRLGPFRFMSHGVYAGIGGAAGVAVAAWAAGPGELWWIVGLTLGAQLGAALWAQLVEGSPQLLRPYGYFGSVVAVIMLSIAAGLSGLDGWLLLSAMAVGACFTQAIGRLRCLVQGCCHGRPTGADWGVRFTHPRSRVVRLSGLGGVPLHPTQLYSVLWTLLVGFLLIRLWLLAAPLTFIAGGYLVLIGLGRFVEEHFRGEPQTACVAGLRLYQWLAIGFVIAGAALTTLGGQAAPAPSGLGWEALPPLLLVALLTTAAYGLDAPGSSRRFSRLV